MQESGPNELIEQGAKSPLQILVAQFTETMVVILLLAAVVSGLLGKTTETVAILAAVLMFAILGFVQEHRAERAMAALRKLAVPNVRVRRGGQVESIPARRLVPGDTCLVEAGNLVLADVRSVKTVNLRVQKATLTGSHDRSRNTPMRQPIADCYWVIVANSGTMGAMATFGRLQPDTLSDSEAIRAA